MVGMWHFGWEMRRRRGLRIWALSILEHSPKNGAELIDEIEAMSRGWWKPSPGSIYPLLESLLQEGLVKKRDDGRYELTEKARQEIGYPFGMTHRGGPPRTVEDMVNELSAYTSYLEDLSKTDKAKIDPHREKIKKIGNRLSTVSG
jgi:DNA-binding PadR family transcriptional regulator